MNQPIDEEEQEDTEPLNWDGLDDYRAEYRADIIEKLSTLPAFLINYLNQQDNQAEADTTTNVLPFKPPSDHSKNTVLEKLPRRQEVNETQVVWLQAAADGNPINTRSFTIEDDFGTAFEISLLTDINDPKIQILRAKIQHEERWPAYEGKTVHVSIDDENKLLTIENGYAKVRITTLEPPTFITLHSELDEGV